MSREARVLAHAKINLELLVLAREEGGHHGLQTVFHRLALGDEVRVRVDVAGRTLDCGGPELPTSGLGPVQRNLAWRAAVAYAEATGWPDGFAIEVEKLVPTGGGLGGGSADAGAVLRALDALAPAPLGEERLLQLAAPLGADVPFLTSRACHVLAWSRGERMLALPPLPDRPVALIVPPVAIDTAEAYARLAASRGEWRPAAMRCDLESLAIWDAVARRARNDFEPVALAWHPALASALDWLRARGAAIAMLAGSGSTLFGVFEPTAAPDASSVPPMGRLVLTHTLSRVVGVQLIG
ncbi:MAG TPA: 4-(cytidine 5'-diphospho)-2-C-methyl-D-erythritol kinase [Gemmatimonadaceae bacterium]|nr:4-(cytidine 5'-diphospho)-2-C-methyl-D-erythritol kinase [Gemmatimonadaceae bacterium]